MNNINYWFWTLVLFWTCGAIGCLGTKDSDPLWFSCVTSILLGFLYLLKMASLK